METSLVLPTKNAEWCLPYCFNSIKNLDPQPNEILICIGRSTDRTEELVLQFAKESKTPVSILYDKDDRGTGYAISILAESAKNELVLWIDSDMLFPKNWVKAVIHVFETHNISILGCIPHEINPGDMPKTVVPEIDLDNIWYRDGSEARGGMMAFKKSTIISLGNFDPLFSRGQDWDMMIRANSQKIKCGVHKSYYHAGLVGKVNLRKVLKRQTFWKFFYKYSWKYCFIDLHHTVASGLRHAFIISLIAFLFTRMTIFLSLLGFSVVGLILGILVTYQRFTYNLLFLQLVGSLGEIYQFLSVFSNKNKQKFGYGAKWLK